MTHYHLVLPNHNPGEEAGTQDQLESAGCTNIRILSTADSSLTLTFEHPMLFHQVDQLVRDWVGGAGEPTLEIWVPERSMTQTQWQWAADTEGRAILEEVNQYFSTSYPTLNVVPRHLLDRFLRVTHDRLQTRIREPELDTYKLSLEVIQANMTGLLNRWTELKLQQLQIQRKLGEAGYLSNYPGRLGDFNLLIQSALVEIHDTMVPTNSDGEPLDDDDMPLNNLRWTIINLLDGELDHMSYAMSEYEERTRQAYPNLGGDELRAKIQEAVLEDLKTYLLHVK